MHEQYLGYLAPLIIAQAPPPVSSTVRPSTRGNATLGISMLAHKLQGICAQGRERLRQWPKIKFNLLISF